MEIKLGDIIKYSFPYQLNKTSNCIVGYVGFVCDDFLLLKSSGNINVKISFKNFINIKKLGYIEKSGSILTEI